MLYTIWLSLIGRYHIFAFWPYIHWLVHALSMVFMHYYANRIVYIWCMESILATHWRELMIRSWFYGYSTMRRYWSRTVRFYSIFIVLCTFIVIAVFRWYILFYFTFCNTNFSFISTFSILYIFTAVPNVNLTVSRSLVYGALV